VAPADTDHDEEHRMSRFNRFGPTGPKPKVAYTSGKGVAFVDYKNVEDLRRMLSPNGKIYGRKRLSTTAREQAMVAQAIKRARFMGLLPYTSATL
jgi:small subunit ribosomal protein S18